MTSQPTSANNAAVADSEHYRCWSEYWGLLHHDRDERFPSMMYAFENCSKQNEKRHQFEISNVGACYGFVIEGKVRICCQGVCWDLRRGQYFHTPTGFNATLDLGVKSRVVVAQRLGYKGVHQVGGPVEDKGRLRYIDGCSDTLLVCPPLLGDPCLNLLHFPSGINQTEHTHPSLRIGAVIGGLGQCTTPYGASPLAPGLVFVIPKDGLHRFRTDEIHMDVIAYHPDSDWGPTHEEHPMVNRTLVEGAKIDNSTEKHLHDDFVHGVAE